MKGDLKMKQDLFTREIPTKVFFSINNDKDTYMHQITKKTGITFSHIHNLVGKFIKYGLVARENKGRIVKLTLTTKGKDITHRLKGLYKAMGEIQNAQT